MLKLFRADPVVEIIIDPNPQLELLKQRYHASCRLPYVSATDPLCGHLSIKPPPGKVIPHRGISLELFGEVRALDGDRTTRFFSRKQFVLPAGDLTEDYKSDFTFDNLSLPTSSFFSQKWAICYGIILTMDRSVSDFTLERRFCVVIVEPRPPPAPFHKEIGVRDLLHIEMVFPKSCYSLDEQIVGVAYILCIKLKLVELTANFFCEQTYTSPKGKESTLVTMRRYELLDGTPVKGEAVPIRLIIGETSIWPVREFPGSPLSVRYGIRIRMVTDCGKVYSKRLPIVFARYSDDVPESPE
jgi:vacuolar protein sorting-associated protein 26